MCRDAINLFRVAQIVRKDIFLKKYDFNGSFTNNCEKDAVNEMKLKMSNAPKCSVSRARRRCKSEPGSLSLSVCRSNS